MTGRERLVTAATVVAVAACVAACSSGSGGGTSASASPSLAPSVASATSAGTRWWSDAAAPSGAPIDTADPTAAAARLRPSRSAYCSVLTQTVRAGRSLTPTSTDPSIAATTRAFVAELQRLAPAEIAGAWRVLGPAIVALGSPARGASAGAASAGALRQAVSDVARDAKERCAVDLSS